MSKKPQEGVNSSSATSSLTLKKREVIKQAAVNIKK
jgi:hypothetical protein